MTRAQMILDPVKAKQVEERRRKSREDTERRWREVCQALMPSPQFQEFLQIVAERGFFGRAALPTETEYARGRSAAIADLIRRAVSVSGADGEAFMVRWARRYAKLAQSYSDTDTTSKEQA